jgi:hypothetical protein
MMKVGKHEAIQTKFSGQLGNLGSCLTPAFHPLRDVGDP